MKAFLDTFTLNAGGRDFDISKEDSPGTLTRFEIRMSKAWTETLFTFVKYVGLVDKIAAKVVNKHGLTGTKPFEEEKVLRKNFIHFISIMEPHADVFNITQLIKGLQCHSDVKC
jgi:hypothetical protein